MRMRRRDRVECENFLGIRRKSTFYLPPRISKERGLELIMPLSCLVHKRLKLRFTANTLQ